MLNYAKLLNIGRQQIESGLINEHSCKNHLNPGYLCRDLPKAQVLRVLEPCSIKPIMGFYSFYFEVFSIDIGTFFLGDQTWLASSQPPSNLMILPFKPSSN